MALTAAMQAELDNETIRPVTLVEIDWPNMGMTYWHSGRGNLTWGGHTWQGLGQFGRVVFPATGVSVVQEQVTLQVYLENDQGLQELEQDVRNRACSIHWGLIGINTDALIPDPQTQFVGRLDATKFTVQRSDDQFRSPSGFSTIFQLTAVSGVPARRSARIVHSYEDQRADYPTDTAGQHLWPISTQKLNWG